MRLAARLASAEEETEWGMVEFLVEACVQLSQRHHGEYGPRKQKRPRDLKLRQLGYLLHRGLCQVVPNKLWDVSGCLHSLIDGGSCIDDGVIQRVGLHFA